MMTYQCPACGAPLEYDAQSGMLACAACQSSYALDDAQVVRQETGVHFEMPKAAFDAQQTQGMQAYLCQACGAELMTQETTTATQCPYCGSPTILPDRLSGGILPEKVIPFAVSREQAGKAFEDYFKGKKLLPNVFTGSRNRIEEMRKLYVPYWLFDCEAKGIAMYDAQKHHTRREGDWEVTYTDHYAVRRAGRMALRAIPVDGSQKIKNEITESIEPYDLSAAVAFEPGVLAGAMADHADVDSAQCEARVRERVENTMQEALRATVNGYASVVPRHQACRSEKGKVTPVLMPVWLITTKKEETVYTFAINGQTGKLTCDVPADAKKSLLWGGGVFAGTMAALCALMYALDMAGSGTLLVAGVLSLVIALAVVGALKAQLRQAAGAHAANAYVAPGSFELTLRDDRFLNQTQTRRRIEQKKG